MGCHISHTYHAGASLYFTFGLVPKPGRRVRAVPESQTRRPKIRFSTNGATLSHHHAVGYEHLPWLDAKVSPAGMRAIQALKSGLDPDGLFNSGKFKSGYTFADWGLPDDGDRLH